MSANAQQTIDYITQSLRLGGDTLDGVNAIINGGQETEPMYDDPNLVAPSSSTALALGAGQVYGMPGTLSVYVPEGGISDKIFGTEVVFGESWGVPAYALVLLAVAVGYRKNIKKAWKALTRGKWRLF